MSNPTELKHYVHYPICGFCMTAWDVIFDRLRTAEPPLDHLNHCQWGGCDPDVWDYIDMATGWPLGVELSDYATSKPGYNKPKCYVFKRGAAGQWKGHFDPPCDVDNRAFHLRDDDGLNAPWRKHSEKLRKIVIELTDAAREAEKVPSLKDKPGKHAEFDWADTLEDEAEDDEPEEQAPPPKKAKQAKAAQTSLDDDLDWA